MYVDLKNISAQTIWLMILQVVDNKVPIGTTFFMEFVLNFWMSMTMIPSTLLVLKRPISTILIFDVSFSAFVQVDNHAIISEMKAVYS